MTGNREDGRLFSVSSPLGVDIAPELTVMYVIFETTTKNATFRFFPAMEDVYPSL